MEYKRVTQGQGDNLQAAGNSPARLQRFVDSRHCGRIAAVFLWSGAVLAAVFCAGRAEAVSQGMARVYTEIAGSGVCASASDFQIAISVDNNYQDEIAAYAFMVEYDSSVVSFVSATDGGDGFKGTPQTSTYGVDPSSQIRIYSISANSTLRNGRLVILTFHTIATNDTMPLFSITVADDPLYLDGLVGLNSLERLEYSYDNSATNPVLCGRLRFHMEHDYSSNAGSFGSFSISGTQDVTYHGPINSPEIPMTLTANSLSITTPMDNGTENGGQASFKYGQWQNTEVASYPETLYRLKTALSSTNSSSKANSHIFIGFNYRYTTGFGFTQIVAGAGGPAPGPETWSGYIVPAEGGRADPTFAVFDPPVGGPYGGTITASNIEIQSLPLNSVLAAATLVKRIDSFDVGTDFNTQWTYFEVPYGGEGVTIPTFVHTPTSGVADELVLFGHNSATDNKNMGFASFQGPVGMFEGLKPGKLAVVRARISSSTPSPSKLPTLSLNVDCPTIQPGFVLDRDNTGTNGPNATPKDYYVVFEPKETTGQFNFRIRCDFPGVDGDIRLSELELLQLDLPADP